jgi:hypothetical protein
MTSILQLVSVTTGKQRLVAANACEATAGALKMHEGNVSLSELSAAALDRYK